MAESEKVIVELVVNAKLVQGQERLRLVFTTTRLIVARLGKRGIGGAASSSFLGRMSTGLEDLVVSGMERAKTQSTHPQRILQSDKENFAIPYAEFVSLYLEENVRLVMITQHDKFDVLSLMPMTQVQMQKLQSILGPKFTRRA